MRQGMREGEKEGEKKLILINIYTDKITKKLSS